MTMRPLVGVAALLALVSAAALLLRPAAQEEVRATLSLTGAMGTGDTTGWRRATGPEPFDFPADHGPHPDYRTEWWYFTGNVVADDGRRFGFQLTFFRSGLAPAAGERASAWAADQAYMAHFAVTDAAGRRFEAAERFARGAAGLAGAQAEPFRVWLHDWQAWSLGVATFPVALRAAAPAAAIELRLERGKPVVAHGDGGLSRKGASPGNATRYYSLTRMPAAGTIRVGREEFAVTGLAWLDREWGTSALEADQTGWDWFALQLSDTTELMLYRLRGADGRDSGWRGGTFVLPDGATIGLADDDVAIEVLERWRSPLDGARYPARWRIEVPRLALRLDVRPILAGQELNLAVRYWEGAADARGTRAGRAIDGRGYVELTGYAGRGLAARTAPPP